ncbi:MAG TPA: hypothetical protein VGE52_22325, partial [Pirellulales bacterium]
MPDRRLFGGGSGAPSLGHSLSGRPSPGPLSGLDTPHAGPISTLTLLSHMLSSPSGPGPEATSTEGLARLAQATEISLPHSAAQAAVSDTQSNMGIGASPTSIDRASPSDAPVSSTNASSGRSAETTQPIANDPAAAPARVGNTLATVWLEKRRIGLACAVLGSAVLLAGLTTIWLSGTSSDDHTAVLLAGGAPPRPVAAPAQVAWETNPPTGRKVLAVVPEGDAPERLRDAKTFRTLQQAVERAEAGDVIRVCPLPAPGRTEQVFQESITLKNLPPNVVIEAAQLGPTAPRIDWLPPIGADPQRPLLTIVDSPGLKVRGFRFDGKRKLRALVAVSGVCPALRLDELEFQGFHDRGLVFAGAHGDPPIVASRLTFLGSPFAKPGAAVSFEPSVSTAAVETASDSDPTAAMVNEGIALRDCRFDGLLVSAVRIAGPLHRLDVGGSRFFKCDQAFDLTGLQRTSPTRLRIASNTFYQASAVFDVGNLLDGSSGATPTRITLENNLFIRCDEVVKASDVPTSEAVKSLFASLAANFKDAASLQRG